MPKTKKPQLDRVPDTETHLQRFLRALKVRAEMEDGLHDRSEQKLSRAELIRAGVLGAEEAGGASSVINAGGVPEILADTLANRPAAGKDGRLFVSTDEPSLYRDTGTEWDPVSGVGGRLRNIKVFDTTNDGAEAYTKPSWLKFVIATAVGGGAGSAGVPATGTGDFAANGGGGSGGYGRKKIDESLIGATEDVAVGAAGLGGAAGQNPGGDGGTSSFGTTPFLSATGGKGGGAFGVSAQDRIGGMGGDAGTGSGGDINSAGMPGEKGLIFSNANNGQGGDGGSGPWGGGGKAPGPNAGGTPGNGYGSGAGAPSNSSSQSAQAGADGFEGVVIVEEYE